MHVGQATAGARPEGLNVQPHLEDLVGVARVGRHEQPAGEEAHRGGGHLAGDQPVPVQVQGGAGIGNRERWKQAEPSAPASRAGWYAMCTTVEATESAGSPPRSLLHSNVLLHSMLRNPTARAAHQAKMKLQQELMSTSSSTANPSTMATKTTATWRACRAGQGRADRRTQSMGSLPGEVELGAHTPECFNLCCVAACPP